MPTRETGRYEEAFIQSRRCRAFIPYPLPPEPVIDWRADLAEARDEAALALGRLDGIARMLPEKQLFLYQYVRKEAVLSSQIEGTQSSLEDLLIYELHAAPGALLGDVREVSNYVAAMDHGLQRVHSGGLPLSLRLLNEMHAILLRDGRGADRRPGDFRRNQVFIGSRNPPSTRFVPPPPNQMLACLDSLEKFLRDEPGRTPVLLKAALTHVQLETIHPYVDGNGRIGRLLITLLLCSEGVLSEPLLYLSLYFKQNRAEYYERLQSVRTEGDWEGWLQFFFTGVRDTAQSAVATAEAVLERFQRDREQLQSLGRAAGSALRVHELLQRQPICSLPGVAQTLELSWTAANNAMGELERLRVVREITGHKRNRLYAYDAYLDMLAEGTEPLD